MVPIEDNRVRKLLDAVTDRRVIVLGDVMLDELVWGEVRRISPEAPVPVVDVLEETDRIGGSGNVAATIRSLGGTPLTIGVTGRDEPARRLRSLFETSGMDTDRLVYDDRKTTLKTRIIAHGQQVVRADREDREPLSSLVIETLVRHSIEAMREAEVLIVSDYDKGTVSQPLLEQLLPQARAAGMPVFLDPKINHADYYRQITLIKPNQQEAELLTGIAIRDAETLERAGQALLDRFESPYVLVTRGEHGMSLFGEDGVQHLPAAAREVFDVTGAGDTVMATLALARAGGATMLEGAWLANLAAGIVVGKVGTATLTRKELLDHPDRDA
jgi:rfaE bifunctional protein kinase chain/domain